MAAAAAAAAAARRAAAAAAADGAARRGDALLRDAAAVLRARLDVRLRRLRRRRPVGGALLAPSNVAYPSAQTPLSAEEADLVARIGACVDGRTGVLHVPAEQIPVLTSDVCALVGRLKSPPALSARRRLIEDWYDNAKARAALGGGAGVGGVRSVGAALAAAAPPGAAAAAAASSDGWLPPKPVDIATYAAPAHGAAPTPTSPVSLCGMSEELLPLAGGGGGGARSRRASTRPGGKPPSAAAAAAPRPRPPRWASRRPPARRTSFIRAWTRRRRAAASGG